MKSNSFYKHAPQLNVPKYFLLFDVKARYDSIYKTISVGLEFKDIFNRYSCFNIDLIYH